MICLPSSTVKVYHTVELSITSTDPGLDSLDIYGDGDKIYYVTCRDVFGNLRENYKITFTMDETPDVEPPVIVKFDPINNAFIPYNAGRTNVYLLVQDRSGVDECRCSLQQNLNLENMEGVLACGDNLIRDSDGLSGYQCFGRIENLQNSVDNNYYFKCNDTLGRANSQDAAYTLKGTIPLVISNYGPSDTVYSRQ